MAQIDDILARYGASTPAPAAPAASPTPAAIDDILARYGATPEPPPAPDAADQEPTTATAAFGHHALQGAAMGFGDEIGAAGHSIISNVPGLRDVVAGITGNDAWKNPDITYANARDQIRGVLHQEEQEHPVASTAGEIGGGVATAFLPGVGEIGLARGASLGAKVAAGAKAGAAFGALSGLGNGEADLTQGEFGKAAGEVAGGALTGAATGGALGAASHGVAKLIGSPEGIIEGAETRWKHSMGGDIVQGAEGQPAARATSRARVSNDIEDIWSTLQKPENRDIERALRNNKSAKTVRTMVDDRASEVAQPLQPLYRRIDEARVPDGVGKVRVGDVIHQLNEHIEGLSSEFGTSTVRNAFQAAREDIRNVAVQIEKAELKKAGFAGAADRFLAQTPDPNDILIPTSVLRQATTSAQNAAADTMGSLNETERAAVKKAVSGKLKEVLDQHLDRVAQADPSVAPAVAKIRTINTEYSALRNIADALGDRAKKEDVGAMGGKGLLDHVFSRHTALGALLMGHPAAALGLYAAPKAITAATKAGKASNVALARLIQRAATGGHTRDQLILQGLKMGLPVSLSESIAKRYGTNQPRPEVQ